VTLVFFCMLGISFLTYLLLSQSAYDMQHQQLERDLQQVMDEKEDLVTERDVYRVKYDRLNKELHYILKGDERRVLDVDALIMENRSLFVTASVFSPGYYYTS